VGGDEVTFLLDTNVWLFAANAPEVLPDTLHAILDRRDEQFGLSAISLWEVGKKHQIGKLKLNMDLGPWLAGALAAHVQVLPITPEVIASAMSLPDFPNRDPADELIIATARVHKLTLLTSDTQLRGYRHARIQHFTPLPQREGR
jgi:PIN domain nuclease of toxin-antitoxin system